MNHFSIIGLVGRAGAGKDTVASILSESHGHIRIAFADALRLEIANSFKIDSRVMDDRYEKEKINEHITIARCDDQDFIFRMQDLGYDIHQHRSPRQILRWWGTEYRRQVCSDKYWLERMQDTIDSLMRTGARKIVITDVRFINEAKFVNSLFGQIWRVSRTSADSIKADHSSESEQDHICCTTTVSNNGTLGQLIHTVNQAYEYEYGTLKR